MPKIGEVGDFWIREEWDMSKVWWGLVIGCLGILVIVLASCSSGESASIILSDCQGPREMQFAPYTKEVRAWIASHPDYRICEVRWVNGTWVIIYQRGG